MIIKKNLRRKKEEKEEERKRRLYEERTDRILSKKEKRIKLKNFLGRIRKVMC